MSSTDYDIRMLNGLIEATLDSADGYADAATDSSRFAETFAARSSERRAAAAVLQEHVASLGGTSPDDGTLLAAAHRLFVNLRHTLGGGEDHIKAKFEDAVRDSDISSATRAVIARVQGSVQAGHDAMRQLKHALHGTA